MNKRITAWIILVFVLSMVLALVVFADETTAAEEQLANSGTRQTDSLRVYDFWLYTNPSNSTTVPRLEAYINNANNAFNQTFNVDFNRTASSTNTGLDEKSGCTYTDGICGASCGSESSCYPAHHKSAYYYLIKAGTSYYKCFRYVDFPICYYGLKSGAYSHFPVNGLASPDDMNIVVSLYEYGSSGSHILRTTEHELSHWIGARDNVCTSSTVSCVMNTSSNYTGVWCSQCIYDINTFLNGNA